MVLLVYNKSHFSAGGNQIILSKRQGVWAVIIPVKLVILL